MCTLKETKLRAEEGLGSCTQPRAQGPELRKRVRSEPSPLPEFRFTLCATRLKRKQIFEVKNALGAAATLAGKI